MFEGIAIFQVFGGKTKFLLKMYVQPMEGAIVNTRHVIMKKTRNERQHDIT